MKTCSCCLRAVPLDQFAVRSTGGPDNREAECRRCRRAARLRLDEARAEPVAPPPPDQNRCNNAMLLWHRTAGRPRVLAPLISAAAA